MNINDWRIEVIDGLKTTIKNMSSQLRQVTNKAIETAIGTIDPEFNLEIKISRIRINECNLIGILEIHFKIYKDDSIIKVEAIRFLESHNTGNFSSDRIKKCGTVIYDFDHIKERNAPLNFFQSFYEVPPDVKEYVLIEHNDDASCSIYSTNLCLIESKGCCPHLKEQTKRHETDGITEVADADTLLVLQCRGSLPAGGIVHAGQHGAELHQPDGHRRAGTVGLSTAARVVRASDFGGDLGEGKRNWFVEAKKRMCCAQLAVALPDTRLVYVANRERDIHEFMAGAQRQPEIDWLIRVAQGRELADGDTLCAANAMAQAAELIQWYGARWSIWFFSESLKPAAGWKPYSSELHRKVKIMIGAKGYTTVEFRKNLAEIIGEVHHKDEIVDVLRHGKPYASLVSDKDANYIKSSRKELSREELNHQFVQIVNALKAGETISIRELTNKLSDS